MGNKKIPPKIAANKPVKTGDHAIWVDLKGLGKQHNTIGVWICKEQI
jgi:hypothetical protein